MNVSNTIKCPECGKEIGEYVQNGWTNCGKYIGNVRMMEQKYNKRKTAHIGFGKGLICKSCAKRYFPGGKAYAVKVMHGNGWIQPFCGIKRTGFFATRDEAEKTATEMNRKPRVYARVEEKDI
jgi:hypothetical protein